MTSELKHYISMCETCRMCLKPALAKETLMSHDVPDRPLQKVANDLFTHGSSEYVITADYFSNFWEKTNFARYRIPSTVMTNNRPQFPSEEFSRFVQRYDFEHVTSSPHYPKSNGKVESAMKSAK